MDILNLLHRAVSRLSFFLCTALLLLLTSLGGQNSFAETTSKVSIQLSWKFQYQFSFVIAAYEKGFYRDAGLEVEIIEGGPGINAVEKVVSGQADFGVFSSALIVEYGKGKPVVALASTMQHSPVALISDKPEISSALDLAGKTIAVSPDTRDEIIAYLRSSGIGDQHVNVIPKTKWGLANLDDADAISAYISNEGYFTNISHQAYTLLYPRSAGIELFGNILFSSQHQVEESPEQTHAFIEASLKGLVYALENKEEMTEIILSRYNTQNKTREHLLYEAEKIHELTRTDIIEAGYMSPGRWKHVAQVYRDLGKIDQDIDLEAFIYNPNPAMDLTWVYVSLAVLCSVLIIISAFLFYFRHLSLQLQQEIIERKQAEKAKDEFISVVSHELRTPLTSMLGSLGLISGGAAGEINDNAKPLIDISIKNAKRLLTLINDILDLSKIEAGKLEYHMDDIDVNALIQQAINDNSHYGQDRNVTLSFRPCSIQPHTHGDYDRLLQVLNNLISNAIKFSPESGVVEIETAHNNGMIVIKVIDRGAGIPAPFHSKIFDKFSQADQSNTRKIGGTGLGLNISKSIVEAHDGEIYFETRENEGTIFFVSLAEKHAG